MSRNTGKSSVFRRLIILFFILGLSSTTIAQGPRDLLTEVHVVDSAGVSLEAAYILISDPAKTTFYRTITTNQDGMASLGVLESDSVRLRISAVGHEVQDTTLATRGSSTIEISLKTKVISLEEVIVQAEKAFRRAGDTLEFKADAYSRGSEQVVEELLARVPGITVGRDGEIQVRGRSVYRVLIEGDDLMGSGYKLLTKNLEAGVVKSVQILESYQQNRLLKGVRESEDIAINLKLKEEVKGSLAGSISAGGGPAGRYDLRTNLIHIRSGSKWLGLGNSNTRGYDPTGELLGFLYPESGQEEAPPGGHIEAPGIFRLDIPPLALERKELSQHQADLASLQGIFGLTKFLKIRARAVGAADGELIGINNREFFRTGALEFRNNENRRIKRQQDLQAGALDLNYDPGGKWSVRMGLKHQELQQLYGENLVFNTDSAQQQRSRNARRLEAGFLLTKKYSPGSVFRVQSRYFQEEVPENFRYRGPAFFEPEKPRDQARIDQQTVAKTEFAAIRALWDRSAGRSKMSIVLEASQERARISGSYQVPDMPNRDEVLLPVDSRLGAANLRRQLRFAFKGNINWGNWRLGGGINNLLVRNIFQEFGEQSGKVLAVEPRINLRWRPRAKEQWLLTYVLDFDMTNLDRQWAGPYFTGYQSLKSGLGGFEVLRTHILSGSHILGDWGDNTLWRSSLMFHHRPTYLGPAIDRIQAFTRSILSRFGKGNSATINSSLDQYISGLGMNLKFKFQAGIQALDNRVNQVKREILNHNLGGGLNLRMGFSKGIEVHAGMEWSRQWTRINTTNFRDEITGFLDVGFRPSATWSLSWKSGFYKYPQIQKSGLLITEIRINHKPEKGRFQFDLLLENLFNTPVYKIRYLQDTGWLQTEYSLQPRRLLFQLKYRL